MRVVPGGMYRLRVFIEGPAAIHPSWLIAATATSYPGAEVIELTPIGSARVDLIIRWTKAADTIAAGDTISVFVEGLDAPQMPLPEATIEEVEPMALPEGVAAAAADIVERQGTWTPVDVYKLGLSAILIGVTAYSVHRIKSEKRQEAA